MGNIRINTKIQTRIDIDSDFSDRMIPQGSIGLVVECYEHPVGYAVDIPIPDERLSSHFTYENVIVTPEQFIVLNETQIDQLLFFAYNSCQRSPRKNAADESVLQETSAVPK